MEEIKSALICRERMIIINGIEIFLRPLKDDTDKNREREAEKRARELYKTLIS